MPTFNSIADQVAAAGLVHVTSVDPAIIYNEWRRTIEVIHPLETVVSSCPDEQRK